MKITDPVKLEEARARMAKARASRGPEKYPKDVETRLEFVRQLVIKQFKDVGMSITNDGKLLGGSSAQYYRSKLVNGSLTIKDMILLGDYMPVDWTLIFKSTPTANGRSRVQWMKRRQLSTWSLWSREITRLLTISFDVDGV